VASCAVTAWATSALGTVMIAPVRRRFMFSPSKAAALVLNSATSIWSRVTVAGLVLDAIFDSVSPRRTVYCSPAPAAGAGDEAAARAGAAGAALGSAAALRAGATGSTGAWTWTPGGSRRNV
jgi:hypothetical protein